jgi:hypothetical protein
LRAVSGVVEERSYAAGRDGLFMGLIWLCVIFCLWGVGDIMRSPLAILPRTLLLILVAGTAVLLLWVLYGTRYVLTRNRLLVRCGPFRVGIPLGDIQAVMPTRNLYSSAALAVDRLHVQTRRGNGVFISPAERLRFLRDLAAREPGLAFEGNRLIRA